MSATPSAPAVGRSYTCNWCGAVSDGTSLSCPSCGATINVKEIITPTGWIEMPGRKDMAKLANRKIVMPDRRTLRSRRGLQPRSRRWSLFCPSCFAVEGKFGQHFA